MLIVQKGPLEIETSFASSEWAQQGICHEFKVGLCCIELKTEVVAGTDKRHRISFFSSGFPYILFFHSCVISKIQKRNLSLQEKVISCVF